MQIWIGDHQNGPSRSLKTSVHLRTLIEESPAAYLTDGIAGRFPGPEKNPQLPFLFKILSFDKALPLGAHPHKTLAEQLQQEEKQTNQGKNERFKNPNHKAETAIALSPRFESFVGFRPAGEIKSLLSDVEELRGLLAEEESIISGLNDANMDPQLRKLLGRLLKKDRSQVEKTAKQILNRIQKQGNKALGDIGERDDLADIAEKVWKYAPGDPGLFGAVFFLNFITLKRGEGLAVPPGCIHTYIEGDIIECMANSDKLIPRSLLASESSEISDILTKVLLHSSGSAQHHILQQKPFARSRNTHTTKYDTPVDEFSLLKISLDRAEEEFISIDGPAIYIVTAGEVEVSARARPLRQAQGLERDADTPGPKETVASEGGHVPLLRRGSECSRTGDEGQRERLMEGMSVFVKPGYEIGFWNRGGGRAEIHGVYCEI
ncbi:hypothetical protein ABW21_db0201257 [Orbilia brochopaga]|nr:hypothetical protein ABW21_db0201257 [Drechslerella brochopaga]